MGYAVCSILFLALLGLQTVAAQNTSRDASPPGGAPAVDLQKERVIRQIMAATNANDDLKQVVELTLPNSMAVLRQNPLFPPAFLEEAQSKMRERLEALDIAAFAVPIYSKNFTLEELQQILAFDQSPIGQKIQQLRPAMYKEVMTETGAKAQDIGISVAHEILTEHPEYAKQIQENQRKMQSQAATSLPSQTGPVYRIGMNGVVPPQIISHREPEYTPEAISAKINGSVLLTIVIDTSGVPMNIRVLRPLGMGLDEKAVEAVQQWRFKPATKDGKAVATQANVVVNFRLLQKPPPPPAK